MEDKFLELLTKISNLENFLRYRLYLSVNLILLNKLFRLCKKRPRQNFFL